MQYRLTVGYGDLKVPHSEEFKTKEFALEAMADWLKHQDVLTVGIERYESEEFKAGYKKGVAAAIESVLTLRNCPSAPVSPEQYFAHTNAFESIYQSLKKLEARKN